MLPISRSSLLCVLLFLGRCSVIADHNVGPQKPPAYRPNVCLNGDKHKAVPTPEDDSYKTCHLWKNSTCCTAEFTQQLDVATVTNVDGFHWNRCGNLSLSCQRFFVEIECFYRCSPNVGHWHGLYPSSLNHLPICSSYCDRWFEACADDMTCATDWVTDWLQAENGTNFCKPTSTCSTYRERYGGGTFLCEHLWGQSFLSSANTSTCLLPWYNATANATNPNLAAIRNIFNVQDSSAGSSSTALSTGLKVAYLVAAVLSTVLAALVA